MYEEQTEIEALYYGIHEMEDERDAALAEVARLREALSFAAGQRDGCRAEVARLRAELAEVTAANKYARGEASRLQRIVTQMERSQYAP